MIKEIQNRNAYEDITIIRTLAVILVVFIQHSFGPYGQAWHFASAPPITLDIFGIISATFNNFSMPLLMFISAYLYSSLYFEKGKYKDYKSLLYTKFKRLLLPAYIFGAIFMLTLGNNNWKDLFNGYSHLWYLPALFLCFVITPWIIKYKQPRIELITLIFSFILIYLPLPRYFGLEGFHYYYFYFYIGILIAKYKHKFYGFFNKRANKIILVSIIIISYIFVILFDKNGYSAHPFLEKFPFGNITIPVIRITYRISIILGILLFVNYLVTSNKILIGKNGSF